MYQSNYVSNFYFLFLSKAGALLASCLPSEKGGGGKVEMHAIFFAGDFATEVIHQERRSTSSKITICFDRKQSGDMSVHPQKC
jgi:hypothetical protein